jgi:hypothetical protein
VSGVAGAGGAAGAAGAAAAAAIAEAIKASGAIVRMERRDFLAILERSEAPLVITARSGWLSTKYEYLTSYKGLAFYARTPEPLELPAGCETIASRRIWIPG